MAFTVPKFIEVRNVVGEPTAFLSPEADKLKDCWINNRINEECTLEFFLPMTSPKWQELTAECKIIAGEREFVILKPDAIDVERDSEGKLWGKVMAAESWRLLDKKYVTVSNDPQNPNPPDLAVIIVSGGPSAGGYPQGSAGSALTYLLQGSGWSLDVCDVTGTHDLETEKESLLANIKKVQEIWGGYLVWDSLNKKVSLRAEATWQNYTGIQIRYAKNLKYITRTANYDLITRLYPFGENDLDISSVNSGVKYIENFSYTDKVYTGVYQNQEIHDPQELKDKAVEVLEKISKPRYTYRVGMVDLRIFPEYAHEDFQIGDLVDVIDEELGFNVRGRIVRYHYNVFMPWQCELDIGEPEERLAVRLADTLDIARFVKEALKPNPATSNLLKGFISTFATRINSANGKLVWDDATLQAIEVDEFGAETGNRVRITPGGIGISIDGGQTFVTAMTGEGILANTIIVNELYALATDDGYTKLTASGLHVFDPSLAERLVAGWWMDGATKRFGLNVKAEDGATTLLDDRGLLQTWQEGRADNVDDVYPLVLNVYLPTETREIRRALLRFRLQSFRAYETGAASGGGTTVTSADGGSVSTSSESGGGSYLSSEDDIWHLYGDEIPDVMTWAGDHWHYTDTIGFHNHGIASGTQLALYGGGYVTWTPSGDHYHVTDEDGGHAHNLDASHHHNVNIPSHTHNISIPNHTHNVTVPNHTHAINFGIYTGQSPINVTCKINGVDRTSVLGGPWNSDQASLNIANYLVIGQWNTIELGSGQLGRIDATVFIQTLMGV